MGVYSEEIILIFLGQQWQQSEHLFAILCYSAFWQPVLCSVGWIYTSLAKTSHFVKWAYWNSSLLVVSFLVGGYWGAEGVAVAYAVYTWISVIPCFYYAINGTPIKLKDILFSLYVPFLMAFFTTPAAYLVKNNFSDDIIRYTISIVFLASSWALLAWNLYLKHKSVCTLFINK